MKLFRITLIALSSLILMVSVVSAQQPLDKEVLFLTFVPNIQFAPVYAALEKGYFAEAGIEVQIEHGDENVGVDLIAANERHFGLVSGEEVIKARANDRPVVYIYEWFQKYPVGIVVSSDSKIETVPDLKGKKVGIPGRFGASYNGLTALLSANDMSENDIQLEPIGFNAPDVFCVGGVEAAVVYINNEPLQIQQRADADNCNGVKTVTIFPVSDAVDMVSNGLITNEQTIKDNPDLVKRMVQAFNAGVQAVINNPAEAYLLSAKYVENLPLSDAFKLELDSSAETQTEVLAGNPLRDAIAESRTDLLGTLSQQFDADTLVQLHVLLNTIELWDADRLGFSDKTSWEVTEKILIEMGFSPASIDLDSAFTNNFLPDKT